MATDTKKTLEQAKQFALSLRIVKKELGEFDKLVTERLNEGFSSQEKSITEIKETLHAEILQRLADEFQKSKTLNEENVKSALSAIDMHVIEGLTKISTAAYELHEQKQDTLREHISEFESEVESTVQALSEQTKQLGEQFGAYVDDLNAKLDENKKKIESLDGLTTEQEEFLYKKLSAISEALEVESKDKINEFFNAFNYEETLKKHTSSWKSQHKLNDSTATTLEETITQLNENSGKVLYIENIILDFDSKINSIQNKLVVVDEKLDTKSNVGHTHPEYSQLGHKHDEYAKVDQVEDIHRRLKDTETKFVYFEENIRLSDDDQRKIKNNLVALGGEVAKKANLKDVLTKSDEKFIVDQASEKVMEQIKLPEDGKDAHEWEFKFHPTKKGLLMYKRSDQKEWQLESLLGPTQYIETAPTYIGGGGGGSSDGGSTHSISSEGVVVEKKPVDVNFTGNLVEVSTDNNGNVVVDIDSKTGEPTGFPNTTDSVLSFDDITRTFTIAPSGSSYDVFLGGFRVAVSETKSITIDNVTDTYYFYFDKNTRDLVSTSTFSSDIFLVHAPVAAVYWQTDQQEAIYFADERHGIVMDGATHAHIHQSFGTQYRFGLGIENIVADAAGSIDSDAQFAVQNGRIADEDIEIDIVNNQPQQLQAIGILPVFYRIGAADNWYKTTADEFPLILPGDSTFYDNTNTLAAYNTNENGQWELLQSDPNKFLLMHVFATNNIDEPIIVICGNHYDTKTAARAGAESELLSFDGLPFLEFVPIATVIYQTKETFTNTPKSTVVSTEEGGAFIDWRRTSTYLGVSSGGGTTVVQQEPTFILREVSLSGISQNIDISLIGLKQYYSYKIVDVDGYEVSLAVRENPANNFTIESNIDMTGFTFVIRGF
jgi:hypothetical protein